MAASTVYKSFNERKEYVKVSNVCLGAGAFGSVTSALEVGNDFPVAVKVPLVAGNLHAIEHEHVMLSSIRSSGGHPNVIELVDCGYNTSDPQRSPCLILTKCDGTLTNWIAAGYKSATALVRTELTRQLYSGVEFLHETGIVHGDLHQGNVLVHGFSGQIKISDFGAAQMVSFPEIEMRQDLLRVTKEASLGIWHGCANVDYLQNEAARKVCIRKGISPQVIGRAEFVILYRPNDMCKDLSDDRRLISWEDLQRTCPGIQDAVRHLMAWKLTNPITQRGLKVPPELHQAFCHASLLGPSHMLTAKVVAELVGVAISPSRRAEAQGAIREITAEVNSTEV
eukprot:scpid85474/ scgid18855/ Cell division control protein 7